MRAVPVAPSGALSPAAIPARGGAVAAAVWVAVAVAVVIDGGFGLQARGAFAALAGIAALLAVVAAPARALAAARSIPVLALIGIAIVTAASFAWTVGEPVRALRWSLVVAGYGGLAIAAATLAYRRSGIDLLAATIALVAAGAGLAGLAGVAFHSTPLALHLGGEWQAAGPFEYPPALAWLQVAAIPAWLAAMLAGRRSIAVGGAVGLAIATMTIALSSSRVAAALAAVVIGLALVASPRLTGGGPRTLISAIAAACGLPLLVLLAIDPGDPASVLAGDWWRAVGLAAGPAAAGLAWAALRARAQRPRTAPRRDASARSGPGARIAAIAATAAVAVLAFAGSGLAERDGPGVERSIDWSHGRLAQWEAAAQTAGSNPVLGVGGDAYFRGSRDEQGAEPSLYAHNLPLELAAELGIAGLALALALYFGTARAVWLARADRRAWLFGPAAVLFLLVNLGDWSWHLAGAGAVWAIALGAVVGRSPSAATG